MHPLRLFLAVLLASALPALAQVPWTVRLQQELPLLGHRNWIVIADSAYPWQTSPGVETIETGATQVEVLKTVLAALSQTVHVRPVIFLDAELPKVPEADARGVSLYREQLGQILLNREAQSLPHEQIISRLDEAGRTFHVLILKSTLAIPYTSVFMQLECGYWDAEAEKRLRALP